MTTKILLLMLIQLTAMISPGPDFFIVLRNALQDEFKGAIGTSLGITAGIVVHITIALAGLVILLTTYPILFLIVQVSGALYLMYLGQKIIRAAFKESTKIVDNIVRIEKSFFQSFREGFFCNLLNPKVTLFVFSIFTQFSSTTAPLSERMVFGAVMIAQTFIVWSLVGIIMQGKAVQRVWVKCSKWLNLFFGLTLLGLGARILLKAQVR